MLVLLDTGILLRLLDRTDPHYGTVRGAVRVLRARGDTPVISAQNVAEFWNVCTRPATARGGLGLSVAESDRRLRVLERLFPLVPDGATAYHVWRGLLVAHGVQGVQVHDARLVALMQSHRITHVLTLNSVDFSRYPGVVPLEPASLVASPPATP